jgi:hypothetical protein
MPPTGAKAGPVWGAARVGSVFEVAKGCLDCEATMAAGTGEFVIVIVRADALGAPSLAVVLTEGATVSVAVEVGALF